MDDLMLYVGHLEISFFAVLVLSVSSLIFLVSFVIVSLKNDTKGLLRWIQRSKES